MVEEEAVANWSKRDFPLILIITILTAMIYFATGKQRDEAGSRNGKSIFWSRTTIEGQLHLKAGHTP